MFNLIAQTPTGIHVCGHRGHSIGSPENTIAAFAATRENGGDSAEIDCVLTEDGEIVLMHDQTLDRTTNGTGLVSAKSVAEIQKLDAGSWFDRTLCRRARSDAYRSNRLRASPMISGWLSR